MIDYSVAVAIFTRSNLKAHRRWVELGFQGEGQIVVENMNLTGTTIPGANLIAAKFKNCNLKNANIRYGKLNSIILVDCSLEDSLLEGASFDQAVIKNCQLVGTYLNISNFIGVNVEQGNWSKTDLHNSDWTNAQLLDVCFQEARFQEAKLNNASLINCDMKRVNLLAAIAHDTVFKGCDFRHADFRFFEIKNVIFDKCGFSGCTGVPEIEGACEIIEPDLSVDFDGSGVANAEKVFELWGLGKGS
ncbi:pentapeptide repeat-containing protein [Anabaena azotica]|uniref:Pentapeptide repeat-containing protein n=1 Tax=Anabaena azotica FACHB-119 TaxID=947527 RepID=A0ABR8D286_9NOST|nr:pentapeptide repeat-containing protein [Anabaena azotica]MBD2500375.1 pentapeptide repeat-containing protein [Anabaena azotica FACHB-119]